jgi:hypothetical protein
MRVFDFSFLCSIFLLAGWAVQLTQGAANPLLRSRSLQSQVVRTDLIRLIPFEVQIAIQDEASEENSQVISERLYQGGSLLTDTITDWMTASFFTKTSIDQAEALLVNNYTSFDSIALELVDDSTSSGMIDGQELSLVQVSYEGVSLWERLGTGTPPMESELVELIQRATFLEDRSLKAALQITVNNLLLGLGIDSVNGVQAITIVDVRAYITPPSAIGVERENEDDDGESGEEEDSTSSFDNSANVDKTNQNLEIIIIVAIVVACLAFALLIFAVVWAWRSDRQDRDRDSKPSSSSSSSRKQNKRASKASSKAARQQTEPSMNGNGNGVGIGIGVGVGGSSNNNTNYGRQAQNQVEAEVEPASSYDLPHNNSDGSYPRVIGKNGADDSAVGYDSVVSEDVSSSLSAYYKSGINNNSNERRVSSGNGGGRNFNDAASMSSMDSYGYSLDGYAPSLGPAQGGYPVGPMQAARDAPMPMGDATDDDADDYGFDDVSNLKQLQDEESVADYGAEPTEVANA